MKKQLLTILFFLGLSISSIYSASLINTTGYIFDSHVFSDGEKAAGYIAFNDGFSVPVDGTIVLDIAGVANGALALSNYTHLEGLHQRKEAQRDNLTII